MSIDETRQRIGADSLDESIRKELFKKFQQHGGKVIKEKPQKPKQDIHHKRRQVPIRTATKGDSHRREREIKLKRIEVIEDEGKKKEHAKAKPKSISTKKKKRGLLARVKDRLSIYFKSVFYRITDMSGTFLRDRINIFLAEELYNYCLDLNLLTTSIIHSPKVNDNIKYMFLGSKIGYYYELLLRMDDIYDEALIRGLREIVESNMTAGITPMLIKDPVITLFKKLYPLRNYERSCIQSLTIALEQQAKLQNIPKVALNDNINRGKKAITYLIDKAFPRLYLIVLNIARVNYKIGTKEFAEYLGLTKEDEVGYITSELTKKIIEEKKKSAKGIDEVKKETIEKMKEVIEQEVEIKDEDIKEGIDILEKIELPDSKKIIDRNTGLNVFDEKDKMYFVYKIFTEFEDEYSFLLTSNKLKLNVDYQEGKKIDIKADMNDVYIQLNAIREDITQYINTIKEMFETDRSPTIPLTQKSKLLHNLSIQQSRLSRMIRRKLAEAMSNFERILEMVIRDAEGEKRILQNPDEKLKFDIELTGDRKLNGYVILDALKHTLKFVKAFRFRLSEGDLSGAGIKID